MMLVEDYIGESMADNVDEPRLTEGHNMKDEEEEDTLSLCDLPISSESQSSSTLVSLPSSTESDYFEFFSEELRKNSFSDNNHHLPENIIFCGKLIPSKQPISENSKNIEPRKQKKWYHFQCIISLPFYRKKINSSKRGSGSFSMEEDEKVTNYETGNNISVTSDKMSIIPSPSSLSSSSGRRSRWYLVLFGISKLPTKMDLSDLRNRRSLHQVNSSISSSSSVSLTSSSLQFKNGDARNEERKFWWVIKALSCGGSHHAQAMVNASVGCFSTTKM